MSSKTTRVWTKEQTLEFINLYEKEFILWNGDFRGRKRPAEKNEAWLRIQRNLSFQTTTELLKKKLHSLLNVYYNGKKFAEKHNFSVKSKYRSASYVYKRLSKFLDTRYHQPKIQLKRICHEDLKEQSLHTSIKTESHTDVNELLCSTKQVSFKSPEEQFSTTAAEDVKELVLSDLSKNQSDKIVVEMQSDYNEHSIIYNAEHDDCWFYVNMLCSKLRKLDEPLREVVMLEIDQLVYRLKQRYFQSQGSLPLNYSAGPYNTFQTPFIQSVFSHAENCQSSNITDCSG